MPKDGIDFQLGFGLKLELNNLAATIAPVEGGGLTARKTVLEATSVALVCRLDFNIGC